MTSKAFNEGRDAWLLGIPRSVNPYDEDSESYRQWDTGWEFAAGCGQ
jgi:hypothetical protein